MLSGMLTINLQPTFMSFDQDSDEHNGNYRNAWRFCTQQEITNLLAELGVLQNSLHLPEDCLLRIPIKISHEGFSKHFLKHHSHKTIF